LRDQIRATREAAVLLVRAHIELARTEISEIASEIGRAIALGAGAFVVVLLALLLFVLGSALFLGEWLFGSMGWGILHGVLLFASIALVCVFAILGVPNRRFVNVGVVSVVVAVVTSLVLGLGLLNQLYQAIGDAAALAVDPGVRPLVVGVMIGALVGLLAGIYLAASRDPAAGGRAALFFGALLTGVVLGALTSITYGPQVGIAIGIAIGLATFLAVLAALVAREGIDQEALKARFYPDVTIDTSKETLEWLQRRMPPGTGS
jgi:hypothetical protein